MAWKRNILVVANVTATSPELLEALATRSRQQPTTFTIIVPATSLGGGRAAASEMLSAALTRLGESGLEAEGAVGDEDPCVAITDVWDPKRYDEIVVSTLPSKVSKWLHAGLPERIQKLTGAPVSHVVSAPPRPAVATTALPPHETSGMGPLTVLGWGGQRPR